MNSSSSLQGRRSTQLPLSFRRMVLLVRSVIVYLYVSDYWAYYVILYWPIFQQSFLKSVFFTRFPLHQSPKLSFSSFPNCCLLVGLPLFYYLQCPTKLFSSSVLNRFLRCIIPPRYFPFICEDLCFFIPSRFLALEFPNFFFSLVPKLFLLINPHRFLSHNSIKVSLSSVFKGFLLFSPPLVIVSSYQQTGRSPPTRYCTAPYTLHSIVLYSARCTVSYTLHYPK